jgi:MFS family permease
MTAGFRRHFTFALLASLVASFLASSSAPTPIYAIYQQRFGLTPITITIVFGTYALAVLVALLTVGKLSDYIGRKPVLIVTVVAQIVAMTVFTNADGLPSMLVARTIQGLCTGGAFGAFGAGMMDIDKAKGTLANSFAPMMGTGFGAIISALVVQYLPAPTHLIYLIFIGVYAVQLVGVLMMQETVSRRPGALGSLKPEFALPRAVLRAAITTAPVLFAVWALAGFYGSLGPSLARTLSQSTFSLVDSLPLFVLAVAAATAVIGLRNVAPEKMFGIGIIALVLGLAVTLISLDIDSVTGSVTGFFIGTGIAGIGFGSGFQGGIRTMLPQAEAHQRSGVLSVLYCACYLGFGGPAVIAGFLVVHQGGPVVVAREYGVAVILIATAAGIGLVLNAVRSSGTQRGQRVAVAGPPTGTVGAHRLAARKGPNVMPARPRDPRPADAAAPLPDYANLERQLRAETDAKLTAAKTLRDAYTMLLRDRDDFAARDAANVSAVRLARAAAMRAGFADRTLNRLGFGLVAEFVDSPVGHRGSPGSAAGGSSADRIRQSLGSDLTLSQTLDMLDGVANPDLRDGLATNTALRALGLTPGPESAAEHRRAAVVEAAGEI